MIGLTELIAGAVLVVMAVFGALRVGESRGQRKAEDRQAAAQERANAALRKDMEDAKTAPPPDLDDVRGILLTRANRRHKDDLLR